MTFEIRMKLLKAFDCGLRLEFGELVGGVLGDVVGYFPNVGLARAALKKMRDDNSKTIESGMLASTFDGGTMLLIRSNTIASALLGDIDEVTRWASVGFERCRQVSGGGWSSTEPEWSWILNNPNEYSGLVQEIKHFLGQFVT